MNNPGLFKELLLTSVALPLIYVGAYLSMLSPMTNILLIYGKRELIYRSHSAIVEQFFRPMHRLDRFLRPRFWSDPYCGTCY